MARILFVDQYASMGGGQRVLIDVVRAFSAEHECRVAIPGPGEVTAVLDRMEIPFLPIKLPALTVGGKGLLDILPFLRASAVLRRILLRAPTADVLYVNGPRCALAAVLTGLPVVIAIHNIHSGMERRLLQWCMERPNVRFVSFCSTVAMQPFRTPKGRLVPNWVSPDVLRAPNHRAATRARWNIDDTAVVVGVLGRLSRFKGQRFLSDAILPLLGPELQLVLGGAPDHEAAIRIPESPFIHQLGKVDAAEFLDAIDIQVAPSLWEEPFGLVAIEGMARARPVIATRSGGLVDIVDDGVTGILVERSQTALRDAVSTLAGDASKRTAMGRAGAQRAERYWPEKQIPELMRAVLDATHR